MLWMNGSFKRQTVLLSLVTSLSACNGLLGKKDSDDSGGSSAPTPIVTPTPALPSPSPSQAPATPACQNAQQAIGANVVFLIDNSNSNSATDCPSPTQTNVVGNVPVYQCGAATNREKAVLGAFDALVNVAATDKRDLAVSSLAVVQFPIAENNASGSRVMTNGWIRTTAGQNDRASLANALMFTRQPVGATPYGAAIASANSLFASMQNEGRARVAILVTDGEPTDRNPADTVAQAQQLRNLGVQIITIYVTNGQSRNQRVTSNQQMLSFWEQSAQAKNNHWYSSNYNNLQEYLNAITGTTSQPSLAQNVTSKVNPACIDAANAICERYVVEVTDSSALTTVVQQIIGTKTVACQ